MRNFLFVLPLFLCVQATAQLSVGQGTLSLSSGSVLKVDQLVLSPTERLDISNNQLVQSSAAVSLNGSVNSIFRVLSFSSPVVFSGSLRLLFDPGFLNGNTAADLKLSYKSGANWHASVQSAVDLANNCVDEVLTGKSFEAITASVAYISLPVNLVSFTAKWQPNETVLLQWQTAGEKDNAYFTIERSSNGRQFSALGRVNAATATGPASYTFSDNQPLSGTGYYRLRQHDRDGRSTLYGVRMVRSGQEGRLLVYPNPVSSAGFTVNFRATPNKPLAYTLSTASGQVVQTGQLTMQQQWISMAGLPAGYYVLQLADGQTARFQKQ